MSLLLARELEADETRRKLDGPRTSEARYSGGEERLTG
jgi:hypothetical protein